MVKVGDSIPSVELTEGNPGGKVNLATELASGEGIIIGVPAAFSKFVPFSCFSISSHSASRIVIVICVLLESLN